MIGKTFGNYRILEKRGEGGMGMFFKATDLQLDRIVGLKTLRPELLADPDLRQRLHTEAKSLARLVHQNIANVLHYLVSDDLHFIVMEYVEGLDLAETVRRAGLLPMRMLGPITAQICAAISYANSKGVIHRDLKPSNIMITADGSVKVTDFGIAKILGDQAQTRTGVAAGSLHYMAPEQIRAEGVDARTDVYQLGATLFELATGRRVFVAESEYDLMSLHLQTPPEAPSTVNPRVPATLDPVILKALAKSPADRYQSADDLNAALQAALSGQSLPEDHDVTSLTTAPLPPPGGDDDATSFHGDREPEIAQGAAKRSPSGRWPWITALGVIVIGVVGVMLWPKAPDSPDTDLVRPLPRPEAVACTLGVLAHLPDDVPGNAVGRADLTIDHPDSGQTTYSLRRNGRTLQGDLVLAPAARIDAIIEGFGSDGKRLFSGKASFGAPGGERIEHEIALTAEAPPLPPAPRHNLTLTIMPFSERGRIDRVWVDDREVGTGDEWKYEVRPGRRKIRVQIGSDRLTDTVTVSASGMTEKPLFIGTGRGRLTVPMPNGTEESSAAIWLDGKATGYGTPFELRGVLEGPHEVTLVLEGYRMSGGPIIVTIRANERSRAEIEMVPR